MLRTKVCILFGGESAEHEVSLQSAKNIINVLKENPKFEVVKVAITKDGRFFLVEKEKFLLHPDDPKNVELDLNNCSEISIKFGQSAVRDKTNFPEVDLVFPVLHGPRGEDGTIQGLLTLLNIPFVGAGVLGSAVGMDKDVMKRLLRDANLPVCNFITVNSGEKFDTGEIVDNLKLPIFVKPANMGSSVGISKVKSEKELVLAINEAFKYDSKVILEEAIVGREIEVSVLGNLTPLASLPGEIIPHHEFYSYEAKYLDDNGAGLEIPAKLDTPEVNEFKELAVRAFKVLCCKGIARVDFFYTKTGKIFVNEINTLPGFTKISMYPKLWEVSGINYSELLEKVLEFAIEKRSFK